MTPAPHRILLVTNLLGWAGAETQLEHLASGLARNGHAVVLLAIGNSYVGVEGLEADGVEIVVLGANSRLAKLRALSAIRRHARRADLVHCTGWDATLWGRLGALLARRPVVITEHSGGRAAQVAGAYGAAGAGTIAVHNRLLDRITYATIAVGGSQRELLEREGVRAASIVHIPNGVPIAELREAAEAGPDRAALGIPDDALLVAQVARFTPGKGQGATLEAIEALRGRLGDVRALFIGWGGSDEGPVKRQAEQMGADWAIFLGYREDVAALLRLADLSVLPSVSEGLPMSLIEAAAVGTPIVATDVGDVRWFLETTEAGICVPVGDQEAFAEAIAEVFDDDDLRARMRAAAPGSAAAFDAAKMVRRYEDVFAAAVASAPLPVKLSE